MDKPKILVIDDDPGWLQELTAILNDANYEVETAPSFELARQKLPSSSYAVIIIDLELGGAIVPQTFEGFGLLDGVRFLEELPRKQGRAIVVSAYATIENVKWAFKRGAYDFIQKQSFDKAKFLTTVKEAVELWQSSRALKPQRELTTEEQKEYERVTREFLRGKPIEFDVPEDAVNPWDTQSNESNNRGS